MKLEELNVGGILACVAAIILVLTKAISLEIFLLFVLLSMDFKLKFR